MDTIMIGGRDFPFRPLTIRQLREILRDLKTGSVAAVTARGRAIGYAVGAEVASKLDPPTHIATREESDTAFEIVMAASGAPKGATPWARNSSTVSSVCIGDRDYVIPSLSPPELEAIRLLPILSDQLDSTLRDIHAIWSPAYPYLTVEKLELLLDLPTARQVLDRGRPNGLCAAELQDADRQSIGPK